MKNACTYLTRRCFHHCEYCSLRDAPCGKELTKEQWVDAFAILKKIGVDFNLILGNEAWMLGEDLLYIFERNKVHFAVYTNCFPELFEKYRDKFFSSGIIDNLSCAIDYPWSYLKDKTSFSNDMEYKSYNAWKGLIWAREHYPKLDCQGQFTIHSYNYNMAEKVVEELKDIGVFMGINFIHYNMDGQYDFFPSKEVLAKNRLNQKQLEELEQIFARMSKNPGYLQNPEMLKESPFLMSEMKWHCGGNPYDGPTIDADGTLRVCGYRKGARCSKMTIFDLDDKNKVQEWEENMRLDALDCPGCFWSYPWMYHYWKGKDPKFGSVIFEKHAGKHIDSEVWSNRNLSER